MRLAAIAALLVLLPLPAAAQAPTQPPTALDLAVELVFLDGPAPHRVDGAPSGPVAVKTVVRNHGPTTVTGFQLTYTWNNDQTPLAGTAARSVDVVETSLAASSTYTHTFLWELQPSQSGSGQVRVHVQAAGGGTGAPPADAHPENNAGRADVFVAEHALLLGWPAGPQAIHPGETLFLRLQVANLGNVAETVALALPAPTGAAQRLAAELEQTQVAVPPGGAGIATLFIAWPDDGDTSPFTAQVAVRATTPRILRNSVTPDISSTLAPLDLDRYTSALTRPPAGTAFATSSRPAVLEWTAHNTGRESDVYTVEADALPGWTLRATPHRLALDPGAQATVRLEATPSALLAPGSEASLAIALNSTHLALDPALGRTVALAAAQVSGPNPKLVAATPRTAHVYRGGAAALAVEVRNAGDAPLPGPSPVEATLELADGSSFTVAAQAPPLAAGQHATVEVRTEPLAVPGEVLYAVTWRVPAPQGEPGAAGRFAVIDPSLEVLAPAALQGGPGQAVAYAVPPHVFLVRNEGDAPEDVRLAVTAEAGEVELLGDPVIRLAPGESQAVAVRQRLPRSADGGTVEVHLHASLVGNPAHAADAAVRTRLVDRAAPLVTLPARPSQWSLAAPLLVEALLDDDGEVARAVLWIVGPDGGNRTLRLDGAGGLWSATVTFAEAGNHTLQVAATDAAGNRALGPAWRMEVRAAAVPRFAVPLPPSGEWSLADPLQVIVSPPADGNLTYALRRNGTLLRSGTVPLHGGAATVPLDGVAAGTIDLEVGMHTAAGPAGATLAVRLAGNAPEASPPPATRAPPAQTAPLPGSLPLLAALALLAWRRR